MLNNTALKKHLPTRQQDHLSNYGGLKGGGDRTMSSQTTHEDRSQHNVHESLEASDTTSGSPRSEDLWKVGGRNEQGDAGYLQPRKEKKNKWSFRGLRSLLDPSEFENENASNEYHGRGKKHLRDRIQQLQEQNDQQARAISSLRSDIEKEIQKGKGIKQSAVQMAFAMEKKELQIGRQDSDEDIKFRFLPLVWQIEQWSVPFAQVRQNARDYSVEAIEEFRRVAPGVSDFQCFLQTPKNLRLLVRGCVGLAMTECLFRTVGYGPNPGQHGEDIWMVKELAHSFASIENSLFHSNRNRVSYRDLHDWRALTAKLISRLDTSHKIHEGSETGITACSTRIMSLVANWVAAEDQAMLEDGLRKILSDAVKLSQTLRRQRGFWSIRHAGSDFERTLDAGCADSLLYFDEATMDDTYGDEDSNGGSSPTSSRKIVEIVISPSLWKCGNTDGEMYDVEFCVERSEVKCKETLFSPEAVIDRIQPS